MILISNLGNLTVTTKFGILTTRSGDINSDLFTVFIARLTETWDYYAVNPKLFWCWQFFAFAFQHPFGIKDYGVVWGAIPSPNIWGFTHIWDQTMGVFNMIKGWGVNNTVSYLGVSRPAVLPRQLAQAAGRCEDATEPGPKGRGLVVEVSDGTFPNGGFHSHGGTPIAGRLIMENPYKTGWFWETPTYRQCTLWTLLSYVRIVIPVQSCAHTRSSFKR